MRGLNLPPQLAAPGRRKVPDAGLPLQAVVEVSREPCFQQQMKWGNTEPSLKSLKFEDTAKKEKDEHVQEVSTMVPGRNIKVAN